MHANYVWHWKSSWYSLIWGRVGICYPWSPSFGFSSFCYLNYFSSLEWDFFWGGGWGTIVCVVVISFYLFHIVYKFSLGRAGRILVKIKSSPFSLHVCWNLWVICWNFLPSGILLAIVSLPSPSHVPEFMHWHTHAM